MTARPSHDFSVEVVHESGGVRAVVAGDLDRASVGALREVGEALVDANAHLSVDVVAATVIDSAALGLLIELSRRAADRGCRFEVCIGPPYQSKLFATTGLEKYLRLVKVVPPRRE